MKKSKAKNRNTSVYIVIAILVLIMAIAGTYFVSTVYVKEINEEIEKLDGKIASLTETRDKLEGFKEKMPEYQAQTEEYNEKVDEILSYYPSYMYQEDKIRYLVNLAAGDFSTFNVYNKAYANDDPVTETTVSDSGTESGERTLELVRAPMSFSYSGLDYLGIKELLVYSVMSEQKMTIEGITVQFDGEDIDDLRGDVSFSVYYVSGQTRAYNYQNINGSTTGTIEEKQSTNEYSEKTYDELVNSSGKDVFE